MIRPIGQTNMIPICLITGFLGSGKTTLLERIARRESDRRLIYLVNEFNTADVDGERVAGFAGDVVTVAGGSIFCRCKVAEFLSQLQAIADRLADRPFDGVVIEASGIADPRVVRRMLDDAGLADRFTVARVVVVVDPGRFGKLLATLPNITAQVEAADLAVVNKTDLHDEAALDETEQALRRIHDGIEIIRTAHGAAPFDLFAASGERDAGGELAPGVDPNFAKFVLTLPEPIQADRLREVISTLGDDLYRAKGFARVGGRWAYVDHAAGVLRIEPVAERAGPGELAVIVRGAAAERATGQLSTLQGN